MPRIDIDSVSTLIREVAAAEVLPRFRRLAAAEVRQKTGPGDLVTVADEAAERALSDRLAAVLPGSTVVGEEATASDPGLLDRLSDDAPVWVIDPVDGTMNFANGREEFAIMVALVVGGRTVAGWILDPLPDRMAVAEEGSGTRIDGTIVRVASSAPLEAMVGAVGWRFQPREVRERLAAKPPTLGAIHNLACAGHEYLRLVLGQSHFATYRRTMPWDHAAGHLIHAEAGGHAAKLDGTPWRPTDRDGGLLLAPDAQSWAALKRTIFGA